MFWQQFVKHGLSATLLFRSCSKTCDEKNNFSFRTFVMYYKVMQSIQMTSTDDLDTRFLGLGKFSEG